MILGPRYKICRRVGSGIFEKCQTPTFALREERRAGRITKRPKTRSSFGNQLNEKQKARLSYGLSEKQFRKYVNSATGSKSLLSPTEALYQGLETRLDNVIYRMGIAKTRRMARQLVSHGHITVNGTKMTIPSYTVKISDSISIREGSKTSPIFSFETFDASVPTWLTFDVTKKSGKLEKLPLLDPTQEVFNLTSVIEYYSR